MPPPYSNSGGPLTQKSTDELLEVLEQWRSLIRDQRHARRKTLAMLSELAQELGARGVARSPLSKKIDILATEYSTIDRELSHVITGNVMSLDDQPRNNIVRHHRVLTGLPHPLHIRPGHSASANLSGDDQSGPTVNDGAGGVRVPVRTRYCGVMVPPPANPPDRIPLRSTQDTRHFKLHCVICDEAFRDHKRVLTHFTGCVERNGNVNGARWYDHASINEANLPEGVLEPVRE